MQELHPGNIAKFVEPFRVAPGSRVVLSRDFDPAFKAGVTEKKDGIALLHTGGSGVVAARARDVRWKATRSGTRGR